MESELKDIKQYTPKFKVYLIHETPPDVKMIMKLNKETDVESIIPSRDFNFSNSPNLKVHIFDLPEDNFLKDKNTVQFEITSPKMMNLVKANFETERYTFFKEDYLSYYFMIGVKFRKNNQNILYKDPPGRSISTEGEELFLFFNFLMQNFIKEYQDISASVDYEQEYEKLISSSLIQLDNLVHCSQTMTDLKKDLKKAKEFLNQFDLYILNSYDKEDLPELLLMSVCILGGLFDNELLIDRLFTLKNSSLLLNRVGKINDLIINRLNSPLLIKYFSNGIVCLVNLAIREGSVAWLKVCENVSIIIKLFICFNEKTNQNDNILFERVNEFIRRSGTAVKNKDAFSDACNYLMKTYNDFYVQVDSPNSSNMFNSMLKNLSILSNSKENLLNMMFNFFSMKIIDCEKLISIKEEIQRKKWENETEENFSFFIQKLNELILENGYKNDKEEQENINKITGQDLIANELTSFLYSLSSKIKYIIALIKNIKQEELNINSLKKSLGSIYDLNIDDYAYLLDEFKYLSFDIKSKILDDEFYEKIKRSIKKVNFHLDSENTKKSLVTILLNQEIFIAGSLDYVKEFIKFKPNMNDLEFMVRALVIPQKRYGKEDYKSVFILIKNFLINTFSNIQELIINFSMIMKQLDDSTEADLKIEICEEFWLSINQKYTAEVFLGLCQLFNREEDSSSSANNYKFDFAVEASYSKYVRTLIESISTTQNHDTINKFFNSLSIIDPTTNERIIVSNNPSTEHILMTILDMLHKVSDPSKLIKTFFIENPSEENFWYKLLKARGKFLSFKKHPYMSGVINTLMATYDGIKNGTLYVTEFISLSKQTTQQKRAFASYVQLLLSDSKMTIPTILEIINKEMIIFQNKLKMLEEIEVFFSVYGPKINPEISDKINTFIKQIKQNFKTIEVNELQLKFDILNFKEEIVEINKWTGTVVFKNILDENLAKRANIEKEKVNNNFELFKKEEEEDSNKNKMIEEIENMESNISVIHNMPLEEFIKVSGLSIDYISSKLTEMLNLENYENIKLKEIIRLFKNMNDCEKEFDLLKVLLQIIHQNKENKLKRILTNLSQISTLLNFSSFMIKLDSVYKFEMNNSAQYQQLLECTSNNLDPNLESVLKTIDEVRLIRSRYLHKYDIENILLELSESRELLDFIMNTPEEDIKNMVDAVDEHGDSFIRVQTIRDLIIIGSFIRKIKLKSYTAERENNPTEDEFIRNIKAAINSNQSFSAIDALISGCSKQYTGIKHLYNELSNREEASKIKAKEICKKSTFSFILVKRSEITKGYEVVIEYAGRSKKISLRDLCDLRDRVLLLICNEKDKLQTNLDSVMIIDSEENTIELLNSFIKIVELSEKILFEINDLYSNGYPNSMNKEILVRDGNHEQFFIFLGEICQLNTNWIEDLKEAYEEFYPLTYFNGNQFWELENLFRLNSKEREFSPGFFLLKYACPNVQMKKIKAIKYFIDLESKDENAQLTPKLRIFSLGKALNELVDVKINGFQQINSSYPRTNLNVSSNKIIFSSASTMKIYQHLLSIHMSIENCLPSGNQILYCTSSTSFQEVLSFIFRYEYCSLKRLFTIVRVENLPFELQNFLVEQLTKSMKTNNNLLSMLCVICSDNNSYIFNQFYENNTFVYHVREFEILEEKVIVDVLKNLKLNNYVQRSDNTGAGKTFRIQRLCGHEKSNQNNNYFNFPISDGINIDKISERLYGMNRFNFPKTVHITIGGIMDNYEILDYILFNYLFLGSFKNDVYVSYRDKKDSIFLEISNSYNDILYNAFSILPLIPQASFISSKENLVNFEICNLGLNNPDNLQFVCNYLHHYEAGTINTVDIHPDKTWKVFNEAESILLLDKFFIKNNPVITFRQVWTFINVLGNQLSLFSNNIYFTCENIRYIQDITLKSIRSNVIESLLVMTEEFTTRSVQNTKESQIKATNFIQLESLNNIKREDLNDEDKRMDEINSLSSIMSWSQSNHMIMMFHEDGMCLTPVYRNTDGVPITVRKLVETQKSFLEDYQKMKHETLLKKLLSIVGIYYQENNFKKNNYVLTADNFLKMLLMLIRARANVPIVIMGETGCGKTSLVKFLTRNILQEGFEVINFHAGVKESYIIEKMNEIVHKAFNEYDKSRLWVFFDEINTCDSLGLITEIICQKTLLGEPLPENLIFIAACNPYKLRKDNSDVGLIKQRVATRLVYRVHPLPNSLIDYVWDYGSLSEVEERLYISNILSDISGDLKLKAIDVVSKSQSFIRECGDKFSVSLRDVARFKILHEWFYKMLEDKNNVAFLEKNFITSAHTLSRNYSITNINLYPNKGNIKFTGKVMNCNKALVLALMMCYYNRIGKNSDRLEYKKILTKMLDVKEKDLEEMISEEQKDILTRMEKPGGIAINKALLENVFTLLVCVINKIPLFICGKPGCSKSLSVQLLVSNLRGQDSTDPFFKKLPRILAVPYQGSESSTSEGVERIFLKAENIIKNDNLKENSSQILPLVIFDEIGLAEISKNNPLKVLHSLLEPDDPKVAFVGISNWRLDASKMNRAIYLARPDPDLEDLETTALSIFNYYNQNPRYDEKVIMKALARTYYDFKKEQTFMGNADFHGTRDFYSLIKQVTNNINNNYSKYNETKYGIIKDALCRNFGGLNTSISTILNIFAKHVGMGSEFLDISNKSMMELVRENLLDREARYLLLFTNGSSASYIIDNYLKNDLKERTFLIGSEFEEDKDKDEHSFRSLSDIILYMESGSSIIMKNLDLIYGALYDLFNQNFMIVGEKKNCRIALGSTNNPMCFVHDNFHCVVLVDIKDIKRMDPPFLNRFEKQVLTFESVLTLRQKNLVVDLNRWINAITNVNNAKTNTNISELIITYNKDEFSQSIILLHYSEDKSNGEIIEQAKKSVLSVSNVNLIIYSVLSEMWQSSRDEVTKAHSIYFDEQSHDCLSDYIKSFPAQDNGRFIIYTYSNILDEFILSFNKNEGMELDDDLNLIQDKYSLLNVGELKTEKELENRFKIFLNSKTEWLFIKFDFIRENNHIPMIKFKIDKMMNEFRKLNPKRRKNVVIIVYLGKKNNAASKDKLESHFLSGWQQVMIDNLNGGEIRNLKNLLDLSTLEIIQKYSDQKTITEMIFNIYMKFNYVTFNKKDNDRIKMHITEIIHFIEDFNDTSMYDLIVNKAIDFLKSSNVELPDWKIKVCCDSKILSKSLNTFQAIRLVIAELLEEPLLKITHLIESQSAFHSFFIKDDVDSLSQSLINKRKIWKDIFHNKNINELYPYNAIQSLTINPLFDLSFPFSKVDFYEISLAIQEYVDDLITFDDAAYFNNEMDEDIRTKYVSSFDRTDLIVKSSSLLHKMFNNSKDIEIDRNIEIAYIKDLLIYFTMVELKLESKWTFLLETIIDKLFSFDVDGLTHIFIFLYKNKNILDALIKTIITLNESEWTVCNLNFIQEHFNKIVKQAYQQGKMTENLLDHNLRRITEFEFFTFLYNSLSKVVLSQLNFIDEIGYKNYSIVVESFLNSLGSYSLVIKKYPESLLALKIVNEYLKIMSLLLTKEMNDETAYNKILTKCCRNLFPRNFIDLNLEDFGFVKTILESVDERLKQFLSVHQEQKIILVKEDDFVKELIGNVTNSKITILENTLLWRIDNNLKQFLVSNIIKDTHLIKFSSMIFYRLFSEFSIDESFSEIENCELKIIFDRILSDNSQFDRDHIVFPLFIDFFRKYLFKPNPSDENEVSEYLESNFVYLNKYIEFVNSNKPFLNILGMSGMKHYLEIYSANLVRINNKEIKGNEELLKKCNLILENNFSEYRINSSELLETLRNYVLKCFMRFAPCTAQGLRNINFNNFHIKWINSKVFENNENCLGIELNLPVFDHLNNEYAIFFATLMNEDNEANITKFRELLVKASAKSDLKFIIIQFFINKVYLSFSNRNFINSHTYRYIVHIFEQVTNEIKNNLGDSIYNFIYNLVYNFPRTKLPAYFTLSDNNSNIGVISFLLQSFNLLLSFEKERNFSLNKIFNTSKNFLGNWNNLFIPGGFEDNNNESILIRIKHMEEQFPIYGASIGLYECSCGYLYEIGNCTRPAVLFPCPKCSNQIGGIGHVLEEREGHKCLINADIKNGVNLQTLIAYLQTKLRNCAGYKVKMHDEIGSEYKLRSMNPICFRWLKLFTHGMMILMNEHQVIDANQLLQVIQSSNSKINVEEKAVEYLINHVNSDIKLLNEIIKSRDYYIILILILNDFFSISQENNFNFTTNKEREDIESKLNQNCNVILRDLGNNIQSYKEKYSLYKKINYFSILDENFTEEQIKTFPNKHLMRNFRTTKLGNWEELKTDYLNNQDQNQRMFLKLLIEKLDIISQLSNLYPIIQFTNYMMTSLNYKLTRQEAKERKIKEFINVETNPTHKRLWIEFKTAWDNISSYAIQYGCKALRVLEKIDLETQVAFVLVDDKEPGYGMYMAAALQYLGQIQNEVLEAIVYLVTTESKYKSKGNLDNHRCAIQRISPNDVVMYQTEIDYVNNLTETYARFYDIFNDKFGTEGSLIQFNFDKIENELVSKLLTNKKSFNYEDLDKIQFKFELLSVQNKNSNLINDIKSKIEQVRFTNEELSNVSKSLERIEQTNSAHLHQIFSSIEMIFCQMKYFSKIDDCPLTNFIQKLNNKENISFFLRDNQPFSSLGISKLVALYESVENVLFKYVLEYISGEYKTPIAENLKISIGDFLNKHKTDPKKYVHYNQMINVVQRFIIRCLVAFIEPKFPIKEYLMRTDLWDSDVEEDVRDSFYNEFSDEILITHTAALYETLIQFKKEKMDQEQSERNNQRVVEISEERAKINEFKKNVSKKKNNFV